MIPEASNDNSGIEAGGSILDRDAAYQHGQEAAKHGVSPSECPFDEDDAERFGAWMDGFYSVAGIIPEDDEEL